MAGLAVFLSSCKQYESMNAVIDRGVKRSAEQAEFLAKAMESEIVCQEVILKKRALSNPIHTGGVVDFSPELYGMPMRLQVALN